MQAIYKNEDEGGSSGRTNSVDIVIYIGEISKYVERKYIGGFGSRSARI